MPAKTPSGTVRVTGSILTSTIGIIYVCLDRLSKARRDGGLTRGDPCIVSVSAFSPERAVATTTPNAWALAGCRRRPPSPEQASPACAAALSLSSLASAPTIIPAQALSRAEEAYANKTLGVQQIRELAVAYGNRKIKTATVNAIRAVIGRHASPPSHYTDKQACEMAEPNVGLMTFKRWKATLYGAN